MINPARIALGLLLGAFLAILWQGCDQPAGRAGHTPATATAADGKAIFLQKCKLCHGENGKLGLNGAKELPSSTLSVAERMEVITNGRGTMTPFREILSAEEIKAVAEYTTTLK